MSTSTHEFSTTLKELKKHFPGLTLDTYRPGKERLYKLTLNNKPAPHLDTCHRTRAEARAYAEGILRGLDLARSTPRPDLFNHKEATA